MLRLCFRIYLSKCLELQSNYAISIKTLFMNSKSFNFAHLINLVQNLMPKTKMQDESKKHRKQSPLTTEPSETKTSDDDDAIHLPTGTFSTGTLKLCRREF